MLQPHEHTFILTVCLQLLLGDVARHQRVEFDDALLLESSLVDLQADQSKDGQDEDGQYDDVTQSTYGLH